MPNTQDNQQITPTLYLAINHVADILQHHSTASQTINADKQSDKTDGIDISKTNNPELTMTEMAQTASYLFICDDTAFIDAQIANHLNTRTNEKNQDIQQPTNTLINITPQTNALTTNHQQQIRIVTEAEFLDMPYHQQYDFGCYIDVNILQYLLEPYLSITSPQTPSTLPTITTEKRNNIANISIRLRDLFARQSIIVSNKEVDLLAYGFTRLKNMAQPNINHINHSTQKSALSSTVSPTTTPLAQHLSIWQFNLYDYKYRPDWLNAKYWANPENFDKYRW